MNTLKKYLLWGLAPVMPILFAVFGLFRPDPENWYLLGVFFVLGWCVALGALGALYYFTTKRQEVYGSKAAQTALTICFSLTFLLPLADFVGLPKVIHSWFVGPEVDTDATVYFLLLTRKLFGLVQLVAVGLLVSTFFPKKEQVLNNG